MHSRTETDTMSYMTDSVDVELVDDEVLDGDVGAFSLDKLSGADQLFLSSLSDLFKNHLMVMKKLAKKHLLSVLEQSEKCQCPSCMVSAQRLLADFSRTWGD